MDEVLDLLYFSLLDEDAADALPGCLARYLGGHSCSVFVFDPATGRPHGKLLTNHPAEMQQRYVEHYHALDPWRVPVLTRLERGLVGEELLPERLLARTEFYHDFGKAGEMFHLLAAALPVGPGRLAALTTHRAETADGFDKEEIARLDRLLPHFRRAMQMRSMFNERTLRLTDPMMPSVLAAMDRAALICDGQGRVLCLNEAAAVARIAAVPVVQGPPGRLCVTIPAVSAMKSFLSMTADAARGGAGGYLRVEGGFILVAPLPPAFADFGVVEGSVLVTIRLPDPEMVAARAVRAFALTRAEAAVSAAIAIGSSPEQVAAMRNVKLGTVRALLRRALEKTESANLRQLTAILTAMV